MPTNAAGTAKANFLSPAGGRRQVRTKFKYCYFFHLEAFQLGPNGTGKSNLLRMLELISISAQGGLGKHIQKAGGMEPLVWDGISDSIRFHVKSSKLLPFWFADMNWLTYEVELARLGKSGAYSIGKEQLLYFHRQKPKMSVEPFAILDRQKMTVRIFDENRKELIAPEESMLEEETLLRAYFSRRPSATQKARLKGTNHVCMAY